MNRRKRRWPAALAVVAILGSLAGCSQVQSASEPPKTVQPAVMFGAFTTGGVWQGMTPIQNLEAQLHQRLSIVHWYAAFSDPWSAKLVDEASADGRLPLISWEPHTERLQDIASGVYDAKLHEWARGAAAYGRPLYLRPMEEMNSDYTAWGGDPAGFIAAWRHMVTVFRKDGATNVRWVWSPNNQDTPQNAMELYYPGSSYVDILAVDGYNFGLCRSWSHWQSFVSVFTTAYDRLKALGDQPIWVTEFGSTEQGGDKAAWVQKAFAEVATTFPRIKALVYYDHDEPTTCGWRIDSSSASLEAFQNSLPDLAQ